MPPSGRQLQVPLTIDPSIFRSETDARLEANCPPA
jgi:hypothetical protein